MILLRLFSDFKAARPLLGSDFPDWVAISHRTELQESDLRV